MKLVNVRSEGVRLKDVRARLGNVGLENVRFGTVRIENMRLKNVKARLGT